MKTALITGASGAIGRALTLKFIDKGFFVVGQYNKGSAAVEKLKKELAAVEKEEMFFPFRADLSNSADVNALADCVLKSFGHTDVFVANAGVDLYKLCSETEEEEWDTLFSVNVKSVFLLMKRLIPSFTERKKGSALFISSIWGISGACMESAYSASKAALIGFSKAMAKELAPSGVTVNCLCPGVIDSPMNDRFDKKEISDLIERTPIGRLGSPKEIADIAYFLCCEAPFITGQAITADGGFIS